MAVNILCLLCMVTVMYRLLCMVCVMSKVLVVLLVHCDWFLCVVCMELSGYVMGVSCILCRFWLGREDLHRGDYSLDSYPQGEFFTLPSYGGLT